jgi:magnesium transporter
LINVFAHVNGTTSPADRVDPSWLAPGSGATVWVNLSNPTPEEGRAILAELFQFHELAVEDAVSALEFPKVESYGEYLYVILHRIDFEVPEHCFRTHDVDFFLGRNYLVTIHAGESRSIDQVCQVCTRNSRALGEGAAAFMHRIVDTMVDHYRPEVDELGARLDEIEQKVFDDSSPTLAKDILNFKRDVASLRRVVQPQRDVVGRLARREFPLIDEQVAYRFRDVYDHLARLVDESLFLQDRITSLLDANMTTVSNQLNSVMKVLTVIATLFMPLTVLTGMWGMNVQLPHLPGGDAAQFWWVAGMMVALSAGMLAYFRSRGWL